MLDIPGYTLIAALKSTGENMLYYAVRDTDRLHVIVKMPISPSPGSHEFTRYRREYAILQRLRDVHGVTRIVSHEMSQGRPVLLLEEVEKARSLSELVGQPLEVSRFLDLAIPLASTLGEIHRRGVIHKDIKPSNIILSPTGEPRIIDFGTAILQSIEHVDAAPTHLIEGTLAYMSPEQTGRMNRSVDYRTDLYSLGVTFYELLTGTLPFHGGDSLQWFHAHLAQEPTPPCERVPTIPPILSAIVMKLLAKVAEARYQSADGLKADLLRCQEELRRGVLEEFPLGTHDVPPHFQMPQRLYGREAQVSTLLQCFERIVRGGPPELILVSGYSGVGKSSVVHELYRPVVKQRGFFLNGKFDQFQRDSPYATLAQAIRGLVQQLLAGTDVELARWRRRLETAWEGHGQIIVDVVPQLELIVGKQPQVQELPPAEAQNRFNRVFQQFLGVFSTPEHPLVMFLDDLQWADLSSLRLLLYLITDSNTPPMLWIGAYRDNEVSPSHPLMLTREEMRNANARVTDIQLEPLSLEQLQQLITDALPGAGKELVEPLSALVHQKTGGNPFFFIQLMLRLNQDGLLTRTAEGGWRWDAEGVRSKGYSDNVVDFMVSRLRRLPTQTQNLLRLSACMGNTFSLQMLARISDMGADAVERGLEPALQEDLLARSGLEQYRFIHDRIQQAAHALTPEEARMAIHLRIGRLLLARLSPEEIAERIFDVVNQLNAGAELIDDPKERHHLARLNAEAGKKAQASTAHVSAITYFKMAFQLIPGDPWETDPALSFKLLLDRARGELMSGNSAEARRLVETLRTRPLAPVDLAAVCRQQSDILIAAREIPTAVSCLLECLKELGMPLSPHPSRDEVEAANAEVWALLGERSIESLIDLPLMTDSNMQATMSVLAALFTPTYFTDPNLLILHLCRMVSLSLRHGNTEFSAHGYSWYGLVLGQGFKKYREGQSFGELACALVERYNFTASRGKVLYTLDSISCWTRPLSLTQEFVRNGFHHAVATGDLQIACYCCNHIVANRLTLGHALEEVYQETLARIDFARKVDFQGVRQHLQAVQSYVQQLRGLSHSFNTLSSENFDEEAFEASLTPERASTLLCWYWILKMQSRYMCGSYQEALVAAGRAAEYTWASSSRIQLLDFNLYRALTLAARHAGASAREQREYLEAMRSHQQQLEEWAGHCPENFRAAERMVSAELARCLGRTDEATHAYEAALQSAREHGFIQNVALASELAARFWRERQVPTIALAYARQAREAYRQWGAHGKVAHLDAQWPLLSSSANGTTPAYDTRSTQIDALTLVKAQQAISGEIVKERLVTTLMQVAIENAGAQRGALLLPRGNNLEVVAPDEHAAQELPWTLISYVQRAREHVLINDASKPHPFSSDEYLARGQAKSVLCLPLLRKEEFGGVLYLENNLAPDAFTPARITLLVHIASQAAISIENARLYAEIQRAESALRLAKDELERRVDERTHELKQAQAQLVKTAREVGMAEIASNVLHNVGNVLTSAVVNLEMMRHAVDASRVVRVKQTATLFEEHRDNLAHFLSKDSRGNRLVDYLSALSDELLNEQTELRNCLEDMNKHLDHIRAIVQVQQTYAKTSLLAEECDLSQLIEDALRIQFAALQRHGIRITRDISQVPRVWLDKHKALQILINLISNARHAMDALPEGQRHLRVRLTAGQGSVRIQVVDNGIGIAPEVQVRLFSHGFTTRKDGHGFGLHASALAAKMMGGRLTLESEGPNQGATATLEIPLTTGRGGASRP